MGVFETWPLISREIERLKAFKNRSRRKIFGLNSESNRVLELQNKYSSPNLCIRLLQIDVNVTASISRT